MQSRVSADTQKGSDAMLNIICRCLLDLCGLCLCGYRLLVEEYIFSLVKKHALISLKRFTLHDPRPLLRMCTYVNLSTKGVLNGVWIAYAENSLTLCII